MKDLLSTINTIFVVAAILALVFLFYGDPDLWDLLHAKAMQWAESPTGEER